jgi:hypothetical protein
MRETKILCTRVASEKGCAAAAAAARHHHMTKPKSRRVTGSHAPQRTKQVSGTVRDHGLSRAPRIPELPLSLPTTSRSRPGAAWEIRQVPTVAQPKGTRVRTGLARSARCGSGGSRDFSRVGVGVAGWTAGAFFFSGLFSLGKFLEIYYN